MGLSFFKLDYMVSKSIDIPGIIVRGPGITIEPPPTYGNGDYSIELSPVFVKVIALDIMRREIEMVKRDDPELDVERLQQLAFSGDKEMRDLFEATIGRRTKYAVRISQRLNGYDNHSLLTVVEEYFNHNSKNFTDRIL